jgi:hypothetical protein
MFQNSMILMKASKIKMILSIYFFQGKKVIKKLLKCLLEIQLLIDPIMLNRKNKNN